VNYFEADLKRGHGVAPTQAGALPNSQSPTPGPEPL
jgi:hypothetical protein